MAALSRYYSWRFVKKAHNLVGKTPNLVGHLTVDQLLAKADSYDALAHNKCLLKKEKDLPAPKGELSANSEDNIGRDRKWTNHENRKSTRHNLGLLKSQRSLDTKKGYKPPANVKEIILNIVAPMLAASPQTDNENITSASLSDAKLKYKIVSRLIQEFDHDVPNSVLTDFTSVHDVINFFETEVHETSSFEDLQKLDQPENLHIQLDYVRFNPETDTMYNGRTAFPGRDTIVTSLKYRRKYSDIITRKDKSGFINHYYGY